MTLPILLAKCARRTIKHAWWWFRQVSGDASYENYLRSRARSAANAREPQTLSPREFYLEQLRRRYSRLNRCC
jgi:uncharacterized short protein YbdD (DUF466 family)